jgi:hypothetical protein
MFKLLSASLLVVSIALSTGCSTPAEKVENAQENVADANAKLATANAEYLADIEAYRKETAIKIAANDQSVIEFNARIKDDKKEAKEKYQERIKELNQKNSDMKKKMDDYKATGKDNWESFKKEFSHDMDELGKAFKDLTVKNVK